MGTGYNEFSTRWRLSYSPEEYTTLGGNTYYAEYYNSSIATSSTVTFGISVPTNVTPKGRFALESDGEVIIRIKEAATYTGGSAINAFNLKRNSTNTDGITFVSNPTVTNEGTRLESYYIGTGDLSNFARAEPESGDSVFWLLKTDTKYIVKITNQSGGAINIKLSYQFHEHSI